MKVAVAQFNPTIGALDRNVSLMLGFVRRAKQAEADLILFPELAVPGYPPQDLLERRGFVEACSVASQRVVEASTDGLTIVFGTVGADPGAMLGNEAWVARGGEVVARGRKQLLPTYDVFDEARHFRPGTETCLVEISGSRCAVTICEDAWGARGDLCERYARDPLAGLKANHVDTVLNLSASPFTSRKWGEREEVFRHVAREYGVSVVVANQVGGNDELVFDGSSLVWGKGGEELLARAPAFEEHLVVVDLKDSNAASQCVPRLNEVEAVYRALVLGLRDYVRKCGFEKVVLGLSGGIDSALTAVIAVDALGSENVLGVAMPTRYSSEGSLTDASQLASNLSIAYEVADMDPIFQSYLEAVGPLVDRLAERTAGDVSLENLQARARGATLMAISNRTGALVLTTGNKSEVAVGYCTLYGDMVGGIAVLSDVPKTLVYRLSRFVNREQIRIPVSSIDKPPSAELRPDQTDQDSLPSYDLLDAIVELYVEEHRCPDDIVREGYPAEVVAEIVSLIQRAEYKRRQAPPGLIVTRKAFGPGRRVPVASRFRQNVGS